MAVTTVRAKVLKNGVLKVDVFTDGAGTTQEVVDACVAMAAEEISQSGLLGASWHRPERSPGGGPLGTQSIRLEPQTNQDEKVQQEASA